MCTLTVSSIGLLIYCLADVDQTHTGFMRIPVERLDRLDFVGRAALTGDGEHVHGPSGFWSAVSLAKSLNGPFNSQFPSTKKGNRIRRASLPIFSAGTAAADTEERKRSSVLPGTRTGSHFEKDHQGSSSGGAAATSAWQAAMSSSIPGAVSREGVDKHGSTASLPNLSSDDSNPEVRKIRAAVKCNSICMAKSAFTSHTEVEIDSGDLDEQGSSTASLPNLSYVAASKPEVRKIRAAMKCNSILVAKSAFASHAEGEIDLAAMTDTS